MNMKISGRERVLLIVTFLCVIFFIYWQFLLSPLLTGIDKTKSEIRELRLQLEYLDTASALPADQRGAVKKEEIKIYPQEEQLNRILKFIDYKFRWFGIKLISLRHFPEKDRLVFDLKFKSTHYQFLGFLNSLSQLKTVLIIDNVRVNQEGDKLVTEMRLLSAYKK